VEVTEPANFTVKEDNNMSLVEYELVNMSQWSTRWFSIGSVRRISMFVCLP
jgi:hypothetical protein